MNSSNKKFLIWYHNEDNDGVFSAAIIFDYLVYTLNINENDIVLKGTTYNELSMLYPSNDSLTPLCDEYAAVFLTDVSFSNTSRMKYLYELFGNNFVWIDHHKPIIDASYKEKFDNVIGYRDTSRSAILNAYHFLFDTLDEKYQNKECPEVLRILSAYDSWSYEREKLKFDFVYNVNKGVTAFFNLNISDVCEYIHTLLNTSNDVNKPFINKMKSYGQTLAKYDELRFENQLKIYGDYEWKMNGEPTVMIYAQEATNTTFFKSAKITHPECVHAIAIKPCPNGNFVLSVYNIDNETNKTFNCGEYMKQHYGGGGHSGAAGCTLNSKQMMKLLATKSL